MSNPEARPIIISEFQRVEKIVQYDVGFDEREYGKLLEFKVKDPGVYEEKRVGQHSFTKFNIETAIGERFNAGISSRRDEIIQGEICDTNMHIPLLAMIANGAEYRANHGSTSNDQLREKAEVRGFRKIQTILASPFTKIGTLMISISPPGDGDSIYKHNFYDIFTLKEDENGRYIDVGRYSSALSLQEYKQHVDQILPMYFAKEGVDYVPSAVDFLSDPIELSGTDADSLHKQLHKEHEYMDTKTYQEIVRLCQPFIHAYLDQLAKDPYNSRERNLRFNTILNKADEVADQIRFGVITHDIFVYATRAEIERLGNMDVRATGTGCGFSGGASLLGFDAMLSPFSVMDFGRDQYDSLGYECPSCHGINIRTPGILDASCPKCGSKEVAC